MYLASDYSWKKKHKKKKTLTYSHALLLLEPDNVVCVNMPVQIQTETELECLLTGGGPQLQRYFNISASLSTFNSFGSGC